MASMGSQSPNPPNDTLTTKALAPLAMVAEHVDPAPHYFMYAQGPCVPPSCPATFRLTPRRPCALDVINQGRRMRYWQLHCTSDAWESSKRHDCRYRWCPLRLLGVLARSRSHQDGLRHWNRRFSRVACCDGSPCHGNASSVGCFARVIGCSVHARKSYQGISGSHRSPTQPADAASSQVISVPFGSLSSVVSLSSSLCIPPSSIYGAPFHVPFWSTSSSR